MFNLDDYFASPWQDDIVTLDLDGERFKVRRLDGLDAIRLYDIKELDKRFIYILAICMLDGNTNQPVGQDCAVRFIRQYQSMAIGLAARIIDLSSEIAISEEERIDDAKKKF